MFIDVFIILYNDVFLVIWVFFNWIIIIVFRFYKYWSGWFQEGREWELGWSIKGKVVYLIKYDVGFVKLDESRQWGKRFNLFSFEFFVKSRYE